MQTITGTLKSVNQRLLKLGFTKASRNYWVLATSQGITSEARIRPLKDFGGKRIQGNAVACRITP